MMDYAFHPEAAAELDAAMAHYESQRAGLGREFLEEIVRAISLIRMFPNASPRISRRSRRCRTRKFPYGLVYQVREGKLSFIAVMDLRRRPGYWHDREE